VQADALSHCKTNEPRRNRELSGDLKNLNGMNARGGSGSRLNIVTDRRRAHPLVPSREGPHNSRTARLFRPPADSPASLLLVFRLSAGLQAHAQQNNTSCRQKPQPQPAKRMPEMCRQYHVHLATSLNVTDPTPGSSIRCVRCSLLAPPTRRNNPQSRQLITQLPTPTRLSRVARGLTISRPPAQVICPIWPLTNSGKDLSRRSKALSADFTPIPNRGCVRKSVSSSCPSCLRGAIFAICPI
jgi:hypothetical protein